MCHLCKHPGCGKGAAVHMSSRNYALPNGHSTGVYEHEVYYAPDTRHCNMLDTALSVTIGDTYSTNKVNPVTSYRPGSCPELCPIDSDD